MLNGVLPREIFVLAWAPVDEQFDARHSCTRRVYKYTFAKGKLDIQVQFSFF
jgi:tRNA pseudouridine38/39 synthase